MAILNKLIVSLQLDHAKFKKGMEKASRSLGNFGRKIKSIAKSLFSFKGALAGVVGVGGIALLTRQSLKQVDALGKLATRLGASTEALSEYRLVAEKSGVSFQNLTLGWQRMTRRASEAASGFGAAKNSLNEMGIDVAKFNRLKPSEQFEQIGEIFEGIASKAEQLRLGSTIFDTEGVAAALQVFGGGVDQLKEMRAEARAFGLSMSEDTVRGVEAANDSMTDLKFLFVGLRDQIVSRLAPGLGKLVDKIRDIILEAADAHGGIEKFAQEIAKGILETFKSAVMGINDIINAADKGLTRLGLKEATSVEEITRKLVGNMDLIQKKIEQIEQVKEDISRPTIKGMLFGGSEEELAKLQNDFNELIELRRKYTEDLDKATEGNIDVLGKIISSTDMLIEGLDKTAPALDSYKNSSDGAIEAGIRNATAIDQTIDKLKDQAAWVGKTRDEIVLLTLAKQGATKAEIKAAAASLKTIATYKQQEDIIKSTQTDVEKFSAEIERLNDALNEGLSWDVYAKAIANAQDEFEKISKKTEEADDTVKQLGLTFTSAFEDAVIAGEELSEVLKGILQDILRLAVRKQITEPLLSAFSGVFGGVTGGAGGAIAKDPGGFLVNLPGRASGGPVSGGSAYVVGERGPEVFVPRHSGSIIPNGGGGATINIIDQRGANAPAVETTTETGPDGRQIISAIIKSEVRNAFEGGEMDRVLANNFGLARRGI